MIKLALLAILLVACQPAPSLTPFALSAPATSDVRSAVRQIATPLPTRTPRPLFASHTPSPTPSASSTALPTETLAPTLPPMIMATVSAGGAPTWTPPPLDPAAQVPQHFLLEWPIPNGAYALNRVYPYGGTNGERLQVHLGVDLVNPLGTPIHAAADGTVVYAGDDYTTRFAPFNNYYGNLVIIQHNFLSPEGLPVFSLYGHMSQVLVRSGQPLRQGDIIGLVGATGIALGPHVHVEVRVGNPFDFASTRNPELWLRPPANSGLLVGRVTDAYGSPAYAVTLDVQSAHISRRADTYGDASVNSDPALGENFTLGNLPADYYTVTVIDDGRVRFLRTIYVYPNQITWINVTLSL